MRKALSAALLLSAAPLFAAPTPKAPAEIGAPELAAQLTKAVEKWAVDPKANDGAAKDLKAKYRVLSRPAPDGGTIVGLVAPSSVVPGRLLQWGDAQPAGGKKLALKGGRLSGHFLVLDFEGQTQWRDLRKASADGGLDLAGYVEAGSAHAFKDAEAFEEALKAVGVTPFKGLGAAAAKAAAGKPYTLEAVKGKERVVVAAVLADGSAFEIRPPAKKK